jgi:Tol biopolymer transport system component
MRTIIFLCVIVFCVAGCSDDPSMPSEKDADVLLLKDAHFPSWSPDGSSIVCNRTIPEVGHCVWFMKATGAESDTLFEDADGEYGPMFPKWMPDGTHIVYHRTRDDDPTSTYEFVIHDLEGGEPKICDSQAFWHDAAFTLVPDGSEVLFTVLQEGSKIYALDLSDGTERFIYNGEGAAVSPDCQWIAYSLDDTVTVAPFGGGQEVKFEYGYWVAWTPDSQHIIFTGIGSSGDIDLIIVSKDGTYRAQLTDDPEYDLCPALAPEGDKVLYVKTPDDDYGPFDLRCLNLDLD